MQPPSFSIIVPTNGRTAALRSCIQALGQIDYPPDRVEVIVVFDGGEPVDLPDILPVPIQTINQPRSGPAAARNRGASQAAGEYLAFIDDDCTPTSDWLLKLTAAFQQFPEAMIGGRTLNALPDNSFASASQLLVDFLYERCNSIPHEAQFLASNNMALPRSKFLALGGFDTGFLLAAGEDRAFCRHWLNAGYCIHYDPAALVYHAHNLSLSGFWQQHVNYGRGAFRYHQEQAVQEKGRMKLERISFYVNLLSYPFRRAASQRPIRLSLLFALMQAATAYGFLKEWDSSSRSKV